MDKYVIDIPEETEETKYSEGFRKGFYRRWSEETSNIKEQTKNKKYKMSLNGGNNVYGAIKTASGVVRFSNAKGVKYV